MKYTADDVTITIDGITVVGYADFGITNAPGTMTLSESEQFSSLVGAAKEYGLTHITVSHDCDMDSSLMRALAESGLFAIRKQFSGYIKSEHKAPKLSGPRGRWGGLK